MAASTIYPVAGETAAEPRQTAQPRPPNRVFELDGIRGIAILLVLGAHFGAPACPPGILQEMFAFGWAGVDLFFVLSGFLITGILLDSKGKPNYFGRFYLRRVFRIFPIYYAYLLLFFHLLPLIAQLTGRLASFDFGRSGEGWYWMYLSNWRDAAQRNRHLFHFWSLSIEEQFYIVWPAVVYLASIRNLKYICASIAIFSPVLRFAALHYGASIPFLYRATPFRLEGLALGALLALAAHDVTLHKLIGRLIPWAWPIGAVVLIGVIARSGAYWFTLPMVAFGYASIAVLCWALVSWGVAESGTRHWFARTLRSTALVRFGKYSYGIYVWHPLVAGSVRGVVASLGDRFGLSWSLLPVALLVGIALSYGVAWLSWKLIEDPCARLKERVAA
jgi:peptidoglycan/LPS O-acetylase OafA/YrhL